MDGLFFLLSVIATGLVMWWTIQNDGRKPEESTSGIFFMR